MTSQTTITPKIGKIGSKETPKKYSSEEVKELIFLYTEDPTKENVEFLAKKFNRSIKSIISKLAKEGVYQSNPYKPKYGTKPATKIQIVENLSKGLLINLEDLRGLVKADKGCLLLIEKSLVDLGIVNETSV